MEFNRRGPHSLGKSVEWKQCVVAAIVRLKMLVPTRWGNQLNGNLNTFCFPMSAATNVSPLAGEIS